MKLQRLQRATTAALAGGRIPHQRDRVQLIHARRPGAPSSPRPRPWRLQHVKYTARNHAFKGFIRVLVAYGAAGTAWFAFLSVRDAVTDPGFHGGSLISCAAFVFLTVRAARTWDDLTDADVLRWLRGAPLPCSADRLARQLGRRPGPVRLSLGRLERDGHVVVADTVDAVSRYIVR
ncbi:hypothetical protein [Kitasatospora sp. NPDC057015]|uniref:hypothetical protein n=1 Tax=Kitasatospora sp. NPDC057015 TaxID=3346001 RepID=UPI0036312ABF